MEEKKKNLYQRIQDVSNEIWNIEKNMTVGTGSYSYKAVQDIDVTLEVKNAEKKHGLVSIPVKQDLVKTEVLRVVNGGGKESLQYMDIVKMTLRIINVDNPEEYIDVESFGRGLDSGDKGFGKASTYARKYALLNAYKIATGEDPDAERSKEQTPVTIDKQRVDVENYLMTDSAYMQNVLSFFNIGSVDDMTDAMIKRTHLNLEKKGLI
jgi:hypothetical protein